MIPIIISAIESPEDRDLMTDFYLKYKSLLYSEAHKHLDISEDIEDIVFEEEDEDDEDWDDEDEDWDDEDEDDIIEAECPVCGETI